MKEISWWPPSEIIWLYPTRKDELIVWIKDTPKIRLFEGASELSFMVSDVSTPIVFLLSVFQSATLTISTCQGRPRVSFSRVQFWLSCVSERSALWSSSLLRALWVFLPADTASRNIMNNGLWVVLWVGECTVLIDNSELQREISSVDNNQPRLEQSKIHCNPQAYFSTQTQYKDEVFDPLHHPGFCLCFHSCSHARWDFPSAFIVPLLGWCLTPIMTFFDRSRTF